MGHHHSDPPEPSARPERATPSDGHPAGSAAPDPSSDAPDVAPDVAPDDDYEPL